MSNSTSEYSALFIFVFFFAAILFALAPLGLARLWVHFFAPAKPGPEKNASYECGLPSEGVELRPIKSDYYFYALLFLVFDVEVLFLLPFSVAFRDLPGVSLAGMVVFVALLLEGLLWAWQKGILRRTPESHG